MSASMGPHMHPSYTGVANNAAGCVCCTMFCHHTYACNAVPTILSQHMLSYVVLAKQSCISMVYCGLSRRLAVASLHRLRLALPSNSFVRAPHLSGPCVV
eukprot:scaffold264178_cov19-Prasinocladus_malaysianus.AAC.1